MIEDINPFLCTVSQPLTSDTVATCLHTDSLCLINYSPHLLSRDEVRNMIRAYRRLTCSNEDLEPVGMMEQILPGLSSELLFSGKNFPDISVAMKSLHPDSRDLHPWKKQISLLLLIAKLDIKIVSITKTS